uniref:Uncharacterized protein n=1 Tax=Arundo donax TaxID=35708 RepID=A0A0A9AT86_ARUDO
MQTLITYSTRCKLFKKYINTIQKIICAAIIPELLTRQIVVL